MTLYRCLAGCVTSSGVLLIASLVCGAPDRVPCAIDPGESVVTFSSQAPFETVVGKTNRVHGWVEYDAQTGVPVKGEVTVDAASLKTDNRLRDRDMRNKFLETGQFPEIRFSLERVLQPGTLQGKLTIHGVTRDETVPVAYIVKDNTLQVTSSFPIILSDYHIARPQFLWMRLAETVNVTVQLSCSAPHS